MSQYLPNGGILAIASAYAATLAVTVATNALETVLTVTNTLVAGDSVEVTSGWNGLNGRVYLVKAATGTTVTLQGDSADTTDLTLFPAGSGIGSIRKINTWTQLQQVVNFTSSGGDLQYTTFNYLEETFERKIPTINSAQDLTITIADDTTLPGYIALRAVARKRAVTAMRLSIPNGNQILYNCIFGLNEIATLSVGAALQGRPVRY
jgi:Phage tail tube protein, TTP